MFGARLVSNSLIFLDDTPGDIQLATYLLLSNVSELSIGAKTKKFSKPPLPAKCVLPIKNI